MLKQRVITALCLAAVLFLILWSRSEWLFGLFLLVFFAAGAWENARLFDNKYPVAVAVLASVIFVLTGLWLSSGAYIWFAFIAVLIWDRFAHSVAFPYDTGPAYLFGTYISGVLPVFHSCKFPVRAAPVQALAPVFAVDPPDCMAGRYRCLFCRKGIWEAQTGSRHFPGKNLGRCCRRHGGCYTGSHCFHEFFDSGVQYQSADIREIRLGRNDWRPCPAGCHEYRGRLA